MTLTEIIKRGAAYSVGFTVEVDTRMPWVSIQRNGSDAPEDGIFMQGDDACVFLDEADKLYNEAGDVTEDEVYMHLAGPYIDCING